MSNFNDFGFNDMSSVNLDELEVIQQAKGEAEAKSGEAAELQARLKQMYDAVQPLLNNLKKDADTKDYIYWSGRGPKIEAFEAHLAKIYYGS
jgi:fructoselysine-6-P-deglycase FrlB-like protein